MHLGWRMHRFHSLEMPVDVIGVLRAFRHNPAIARLQFDRLPLQFESGSPFQHKADYFIVTRNILLFLRSARLSQRRMAIDLPEAKYFWPSFPVGECSDSTFMTVESPMPR